MLYGKTRDVPSSSSRFFSPDRLRCAPDFRQRKMSRLSSSRSPPSSFCRSRCLLHGGNPFFCRSPISSRGGGEFSAALPPSQATECLLLHIVSCLTFAKEKKSFLHSVEDRQEKGIKRGDGETGGEGRGKKTDAHRILDSARSLCVFRCLGWRERGLIYERAAGVDIALVYARPDHNSVYVKRS